jgi:hypothetical protein
VCHNFDAAYDASASEYILSTVLATVLHNRLQLSFVVISVMGQIAPCNHRYPYG